MLDRLYIFIVRNDVWIYILSVFGLIWYVTELWRARNILRRAMFGLERETGLRMRNNALFFIVLFLTVIGSVTYVNRSVAPTLPQEMLRPPTPTPDIFATPLVSPTPLTEMVEQAPATLALDLAPTVTLPGQAPVPGAEEAADGTPVVPVSTPTPETPPTPFVGCTVDLNISQPRNGAAVTSELDVFGTADTPNLQYFTLEINGPETEGVWASLLGRTIDQPVRDSFLGSASLSQWEPGPYLLRLTAVDAGDNTTGQCVIQVTLTSG